MCTAKSQEQNNMKKNILFFFVFGNWKDSGDFVAGDFLAVKNDTLGFVETDNW